MDKIQQENTNQTVEVAYKIKEVFCSCCERDFEDAEFGATEIIKLNTKDFFKHHYLKDLKNEELIKEYYLGKDVNEMVTEWLDIYFYENVIDFGEKVEFEPTSIEAISNIIRNIVEEERNK